MKMMIAGCLNQARAILEMFDEVLHGPAPEKLVEDTHKEVRELLASQECQEFRSNIGSIDEKALAAEDNFVRKITEAVAPILHITLRNKSLDGGYFRAALQLAAAAEFLFAQYETDVRVKANPAGAVGMCNNMHAEIKRSAIYNEELKPPREFVKEMKAQYQTSLGLGSSFSRDPSISGGGRGRKARDRPFWRSTRYQDHNSPRGRGMRRTSGVHRQSTGDTYPDGRSPMEGAGQWRSNPIPIRGPGECYAFQAGNCTRGRSCRFTH